MCKGAFRGTRLPRKTWQIIASQQRSALRAGHHHPRLPPADELHLVFTLVDPRDPDRRFTFAVKVLEDNTYMGERSRRARGQ